MYQFTNRNFSSEHANHRNRNLVGVNGRRCSNTGPAGAPGAPGATGPAGPTGPSGAVALSGLSCGPNLAMRGVHLNASLACEPVDTLGGVGGINSLSINGGGNEVTVAPGAAVTVNFNYVLGAGGCPGCIVQVYVGLTNTAPYTCVVPAGFQGQSGATSISFTAPVTPGVYYIGSRWTWDFTCQTLSTAVPSSRVGLLFVQ